MKLHGIKRSWDSEKAARAFSKSYLYEYIIGKEDISEATANMLAEAYENGWYDALDGMGD